MKILVPTAAALLLAGAAHAQTSPQTPPERSASDLTRDLNSRPPTIEEYLARPLTPAAAPAPAREEAAPEPPAPATTTAAAPVSATASPPAAAPRPAPAASAPAATPLPAPEAARPAATSTRPPSASAPTAVEAPAPVATPAPAAETVEPASSSPAPAVTVLDAAARAALPFTVELPAGFQIVTGRPGPDFRIYTIRRGDQSFVMVYTGPASQFPIYTGQTLEAGGRASVVTTEADGRHAVEHLFRLPEGTSPREIHVWTMSLEGADRALAERIAQSVDLR